MLPCDIFQKIHQISLHVKRKLDVYNGSSTTGVDVSVSASGGAGDGVGGGGIGVEGLVAASSAGSTHSPMPTSPMTYRRTSLSVMIPNNRPFLPPCFSSS